MAARYPQCIEVNNMCMMVICFITSNINLNYLVRMVSVRRLLGKVTI